MVLEVPFEFRIDDAPAGRSAVLVARRRRQGGFLGVLRLVAAEALRQVHDDGRLGGSGTAHGFAHLGADAGVVRHDVSSPVAVLYVLGVARLRDAAAGAVVGHQELVVLGVVTCFM